VKYLIEFQKLEAVRWLGHLDVLRAFERAVRRSGLPVAFTQGFNPRQRIAFASALGVGVTAEAEPAILELRESLLPQVVTDALNEALPPGFRITGSEPVPDEDARRLLNSYDRAELRIVCECNPAVGAGDAEAAVQRLMSREAVPVAREAERRRRDLDLRPFLVSLAARPDTPERVVVDATVTLGQNGTARPAEIVAALGEELPGLTLRSAHRVRLLRTAPRPPSHEG
jgi:radical SAM-linked protein